MGQESGRCSKAASLSLMFIRARVNSDSKRSSDGAQSKNSHERVGTCCSGVVGAERSKCSKIDQKRTW